MAYENYNIFALQGDKTTSDAEVCERLGLDPTLAGTPQINNAAIEKMYEQNVSGFMDKGLSKEEAHSRAAKLANNTKKKIQQLLEGK